MPRYHLPDGSTYVSDAPLTPEDLDHLSTPHADVGQPTASLSEKVGGALSGFRDMLMGSAPARWIGGSITENLGLDPALNKWAEPGLSDVPDTQPNFFERLVHSQGWNKTGTSADILDELASGLPTTSARARGFAAGSAEAVTPLHVAAALSMGTGAPAAVSNALLAAQGLGTATDPEASTGERVAGGVQALGGAAGAYSGLRNLVGDVRAVAATRPPKPPKPPAEYEIQPTIRTGEGTGSLTGGHITPGTSKTSATNVGSRYNPNVMPPQPIPTASTPTAERAALARVLEQPPPPVADVVGRGAPAYPKQETYAVPGTEFNRITKNIAKEKAIQDARDALADKQAGRTFASKGGRYTETTSAPGGPGERGTYTETFREETPGAASSGQGPFTNAMRQASEMPLEGSPEKALYDGWRAGGASHEDALQMATAGIHPLNVEEPPVAAAAPAGSQLLKFFRSPIEAADASYQAAKIAQGENPLAVRQAGTALQQEAARAGLPTRAAPNLEKFLRSRVSPDIQPGIEPLGAPAGAKSVTLPEGAAAPSVSWEQAASEEADGIRQLNEIRQIADPNERAAAFERMISGKGAINTALLARLGTGALGAVIGAPIGAKESPEYPGLGALAGALSGGALGYAGMTGALSALPGESRMLKALQEEINWRNAGYLGTASAQLGKLGADIGNYNIDALARMLSRNPSGWRMVKAEANLPQVAKAFWAGLKNPMLSRGDVAGDVGSNQYFAPSGPLGWVTRPFSAAQHATQDAARRAGVPLEEAQHIVMMNDPDTKFFQKVQNLFRGQDWGSTLMRALSPFQRLRSNWVERQLQYSPLLNTLMPPVAGSSNAVRGGLGGLSFLGGAIQGAGDQQAYERGEWRASPFKRGLQLKALGGLAGMNLAGQSMFGPYGMRDLYYRIPFMSQTVPPPGRKNVISDAIAALVQHWNAAELPDWLNPWLPPEQRNPNRPASPIR